mmetsp:Transcript_33250/g.87470  ORF Transcript_33250/g.87470 Transcript_33250/m.87470 type:complete len:100 (-) Transcript_33250:466-765(-)
MLLPLVFVVIVRSVRATTIPIPVRVMGSIASPDLVGRSEDANVSEICGACSPSLTCVSLWLADVSMWLTLSLQWIRDRVTRCSVFLRAHFYDHGVQQGM